MSFADKLFVENVRDILDNGYSDAELDVRPHWEDGTKAHTVKKFCIVNRYDLTKEFPIMTLRRTAFKSAIDELLWIWQKKSNNVHDLKSHIWDSWADENGSIGKAYGYQLGVKHTYKEGEFDQVDRVIYDLKNNPQSRSQDMLTANNWNVVQYAVLQHMMAQVSGLKVGELVHVIADAHIYDRHIPIVKKMIEGVQYPAPKFVMNPDKKDFYDFTVDDFALEDYRFNTLDQKIEVAI